MKEMSSKKGRRGRSREILILDYMYVYVGVGPFQSPTDNKRACITIERMTVQIDTRDGR